MYSSQVKKVLISENDIQSKIKEIAAEINKEYAGKQPILIGILKGAFVFLADLSRELTVPHSVDFMDVSSYGEDVKTSGIVKIEKDIDRSVAGEDVILVDDIIDTGLTMTYISDYLQNHKPASIRICSLLSKPSRRVVEVKSDFLGFEIPDEFVIGYGLGHKGLYRNLKYIAILDEKYY